MPEERRKSVGRTPEECRAESEDGEEKLEERRKNAAQRVIWNLWSILNFEARLLDIR